MRIPCEFGVEVVATENPSQVQHGYAIVLAHAPSPWHLASRPLFPTPSPKDYFEHEISTAEKPSHAQEGKYVSIFRISIFLRWFYLKSYKNARFLAFPMQKP